MQGATTPIPSSGNIPSISNATAGSTVEAPHFQGFLPLDNSALITTSRDAIIDIESRARINLPDAVYVGDTGTQADGPGADPLGPAQSHDLSDFNSIIGKIKNEFIIHWYERTTAQKCTTSHHIVADFTGCYAIGACSVFVMIAILIVGIMTKKRLVSIAALAVIGGCWVAGSLGLTVAILDTDSFLITNKLPAYQYLSFLKILSKSPLRLFPGYSFVDPYMPKFPFSLRL